MSKETGGPAFPMGSTEAAMYASCLEDLANPALLDNAERVYLEAKAVALCGMTLRDYFAAHAPEPYKEWRGGSRGLMDIVEWRWFYADQMLKAREQ